MQTRKRVLINAFTVRALRDTFSPARGAGIRTLHCVGLWLLFYLVFHKILGVSIFVCFKLIFYSLCVQCSVTPTIVVPFSLLNYLKFCCGRRHGSLCNQFLLRHHWDCNSDSSKCCCTYNWSWQVKYSSDDWPIFIFSPSSTCSRMCFFCDMFLFLQLFFFVLFFIRGRKREGGRCSPLLLMVILSNFIASVVFEVGVGSEPALRS